VAQKRSNSRQVLTEIQLMWLNGTWLLGTANANRGPDETMQSLALMSGIGADALWEAHGNPETHFWRPGMRLPISMEDLNHHAACWLESGEGDNDPYGGDSYFIHTHYSEDEKQKLWGDFGDKENFHWERVLRRPIPIGASVDAAMVAFTTIGPFNIE
jgi:hypothetical protein